MKLDDLEKILTDIVMDLKPAQEPILDADPYESVNFDHMTKDNSAWVDLIARYLKIAKTFEIHYRFLIFFWMMFSKAAIMEQKIIINR